MNQQKTRYHLKRALKNQKIHPTPGRLKAIRSYERALELDEAIRVNRVMKIGEILALIGHHYDV